MGAPLSQQAQRLSTRTNTLLRSPLRIQVWFTPAAMVVSGVRSMAEEPGHRSIQRISVQHNFRALQSIRTTETSLWEEHRTTARTVRMRPASGHIARMEMA